MKRLLSGSFSLLAGSFLVIFSLVSMVSRAQSDLHYFQRIPRVLLRQDFQLLRDTLQKSHPGLYRYRTKAEMDHLLDSCYASIPDSETFLQFYIRVAYVIAAIGDGHTNCRPQHEAWQEFINREKFFPAMVIFIHSHAYIFCCNQDPKIRGSELLSINGRPMHEVLERIYGTSSRMALSFPTRIPNCRTGSTSCTI